MKKEKNINQFSQDSKNNNGYLYTNTERLSCKVANQKLTQEILKLCGELKNKSFVDVGCGDGKYTIDFLRLKPTKILALNPATSAIKTANDRYKNKNITFIVGNIYKLKAIKQHFDVAVVRGVLHHLYNPAKAISQLSTFANEVIIAEPNGYNPLLKVIEKLSPYHRQHEKKSYSSALIKKWISQNGGSIEKEGYYGIVPFFCPSFIVPILKKVEPYIESTSILNRLLCAVYITKINFNSK